MGIKLRRKQQLGRRLQGKIQLDFKFDQGFVGFGFFPFGNGLAHLARMLPVERFQYRFTKGRVLGVLDQHAYPRCRLKDKPMAADGGNQQTNTNNSLQTAHHRN